MLKDILLQLIFITGIVPAGNPTVNYMHTDYAAYYAQQFIEHSSSTTQANEIDGAVIHDPVLLEDVYQGEINTESAFGENLGYNPNTVIVEGYEFPFIDMYGNTGAEEDYDELNNILDQNLVALVGNNGIKTFFGHYYDISGNGIFNPLADQNLLHDGSEVIVTDDQGRSKGYYITQTIEFLHGDQDYQFYGPYHMPSLAYHGSFHDMVYIQYCRWDIQLGLLITSIGHRIW